MHAGDSGVFPDSIGSLFYSHITNRRYYRNIKEGMKSLNRQLTAYYTANAARKLTRVTPLKYSQIRSDKPGFPFLKASAAGCRHLGDFALILAQQHLHGCAERGPFRFPANHRLAGQDDHHNRLVVACFQGMVDYQRSCYGQPFPVDECRDGIYAYMNAHISLHDLYRHGLSEEEAWPLGWHFRPKMHMMQHLIEGKTILFGSPMMFWCYGDEDYMGAIKSVCAMTKHPATLEVRVCEKAEIMSGVIVYELEKEAHAQGAAALVGQGLPAAR